MQQIEPFEELHLQIWPISCFPIQMNIDKIGFLYAHNLEKPLLQDVTILDKIIRVIYVFGPERAKMLKADF